MSKRIILAIAVFCAVNFGLEAQSVNDFRNEFDSLSTLLHERTSVRGSVSVTKVQAKGKSLEFFFTQNLGDYPWRTADVKWFRSSLEKLLPKKYSGCSVGIIHVGDRNTLEDIAMPGVKNNGNPGTDLFRTKDHRHVQRFIEETDEKGFSKGLTGRNIALWQSHGRYYEEKLQRWEWQRAPLFQTVEDLYTQSYVLPFLIPMLENAGAYVMTPRERDIQTNEVIADNDPSFKKGRGEGIRISGKYSESGGWSDAGTGFADTSATYSEKQNPFLMGTARMAGCYDRKNKQVSKAIWTPDIPERGEYAVYISWKTLPNSTSCAHYQVQYLGGSKDFIVDQKMGGGTWIYLGTFEFDKGTTGCVILDNMAPKGRKNPKKTVITADAVRFGGGMGKIARKPKDGPVSEYSTSGLPSYTEGALYSMQWAGTDSTILNRFKDDYTSDYADRGAWVSWMSGGSWTNPGAKGEGIPVDLSFAFHSDAGTTPDDSIVGTLSIYTLLADGKDKFADGEERLQQRLYADYVQTQVVNDIRKTFNPDWSRRGLWDRSYSESRTPSSPAMILELLSHQNFEDMKYGLDPAFRFTVSRAIYKAMLKFLSGRYGCDYVVQPLPVNTFATSFKGSRSESPSSQVTLSWKNTVDSLEPTAVPEGYLLYTRIDDGPFDEGMKIEDIRKTSEGYSSDVSILPGHIYSYRIVAFNDGGKSFPSETLSVGVPDRISGGPVIVVNNFTRVSAPAWFDTPEYAGFDNELDAGVPYVNEINFLGDQYQFRRNLPWQDDDNPGFGASYTDQAGKLVPGNTFDFTIIHGKAMMACGHPYHSASSAAFTSDFLLSESDSTADIICGKQVSTRTGIADKSCRFQVYPLTMQKALSHFTGKGGNLLISGADIGTDVWDRVFPVLPDSLFTASTKEFVTKTLGYRWMTNYASRSAELWPMRNGTFDVAGKVGRMAFHNERNSLIYNVETPDGIVPASDSAKTFLRYADTNISAATCFNGKGYRTACLGFPIEVLKDQNDINTLVAQILAYFEAGHQKTK